MGAITRTLANNITTGGVILPSGINNTSISNVTALPAGVGGKVLQVVTATDTTERSTTSTSFVTASNTLTITITPSATSSKIFLVTSGTGYQTGSSSKFTIYRGGTNLSTASENELVQFEANRGSIGMTFLDSPATTSATTYQVYFRNSGGSTTNLNPNSNQSVITAYEIAG